MRLECRQRADHSYLEDGGLCWGLSEYYSGAYRCNHVNRIIANLKCRPSIATAHPARAFYKRQAIASIAVALRHFEQAWVEATTWVPIPISRAIGTVDYDDRLSQILCAAFNGYDLDLRLLLRQTHSMPADHETPRRVTMQQLLDLVEVDVVELRTKPLRERIGSFDDLLTSGEHCKCCQRRLRPFAPRTPIYGCFIARRAMSSRWWGVPRV